MEPEEIENSTQGQPFKQFFAAFGSLPLAFKTYVVGSLCDIETLYRHFRDRFLAETGAVPSVHNLPELDVIDELVKRVTVLEERLSPVSIAIDIHPANMEPIPEMMEPNPTRLQTRTKSA